MFWSHFGAIFGPTCMYIKLRNFRTVPPGVTNLVSKCAGNLKEKSHKVSRQELCALQSNRAKCRGGGGLLGPPPQSFLGLSVEFYREFWPEIQDIVIRSFNNAFSEGHLSYLQRKGVISLLLKRGDKEELDNWRPITLLNIDYKILAMVLTKRLQKVLPDIINEDQVGYIKGRSGIYNAWLTSTGCNRLSHAKG